MIRNVKGLLPVHMFRRACEMVPLMQLATRCELALIEDACEVLGTEYNYQRVMGGFLCSLRNQGRDDSGAGPNHVRLGCNHGIDKLSGA